MQKITPKIKAYILIFLLVFIAILYFSYGPAPKLASIQQFKCPENYTEDDAGTEEYKNALTSWTSEFFEANPKATSSDWSMAKSQFWVDNNCTVALERSKLSGKVSDLKKWELVDYEIQDGLDTAINSTN